MYQLHVHLGMSSCRLHDAHVFAESLAYDRIHPHQVRALFNGFVSISLNYAIKGLRHGLLIVHEELLLIENPLGRHGTVRLTQCELTPWGLPLGAAWADWMTHGVTWSTAAHNRRGCSCWSRHHGETAKWKSPSSCPSVRFAPPSPQVSSYYQIFIQLSYYCYPLNCFYCSIFCMMSS